jgi:ketosteroid isomerase-like protein
MGNRDVVEQLARALAEEDLDAQIALLHDDYVGQYPQSGEIIRGRANRRAITENYPGGPSLPVTVSSILGEDDKFVSAPSWPAWSIVHVAGSGDEFTMTGTITYPDGQTWHAIALLTLRDGKIWRETDYFAAPFESPEWRPPYVERSGQ